MTVEQAAANLKAMIRERYGSLASTLLREGPSSCCQSETSCCGSTPAGRNAFSEGIYAVDELDGVPLQAALAALGCANPLALSELREGEIVLDIGSGGGLDVILAARRVGPAGHAYGLDMTDQMLDLAWRNAVDADVGNVTFLKGEIEAMPIPGESIDVIISNCVINLSPDKDRALAEIYRVLRPGGRLAIADVVIRGGLPPESPVTVALRSDPVAWGSCLAGALSDEEYQKKLAAAGFVNVELEVVRTHRMAELFGASPPAWVRELPQADVEAVMSRFTSTMVRARKPADAQTHFIHEAYEQVATTGASMLCCSPREVYGPDDLASLPEQVLRLSSGCGAPVTDAALECGATVIDVGSGAGADCFLAAQLVGPTGRVTGVDPSPTMRAIATRHAEELKLDWVSFVEGVADRMPIPDASADVVISNCVLSLASDPVNVWREIVRVLRPGGRFMVSDVIGGDKPATLESKTRCETGITWAEYRQVLADAGFTGVEPLRVREVTFRDGHVARSVTLRGRAGMPAYHSLQIFAPARHRAVAEQMIALCGHAGSLRDARLALRVVDLADPQGQSVLRLVLEKDLPDWDGETWPALAVVGEGRLLAIWHPVDGEVPLLEGLVERVLSQLLMANVKVGSAV